jgi:hypothetical protein
VACAAIAATLAALHGGAHATLGECRVTEQAPYVVFLSEPTFSNDAFASRAQMLKEFDRLHLHLAQRRDEEMAGLAGIPFKVARCVGRVPAIDGADFTADVVRSLYTRSVVIEVWGFLDRTPRVGGVASPKAQMNYLLMPLSRAHHEHGLQVPALHRFDYPDGDIRAADYVNLLSNRDLHAFVVSAIGVMAFDGDEFAKAHEYLCAAAGRLGAVRDRLAKRPQGQAQAAEVESLRVHVSGLAGKALDELRRRAPAGPNASVGLQVSTQPCGAPVKPR